MGREDGRRKRMKDRRRSSSTVLSVGKEECRTEGNREAMCKGDERDSVGREEHRMEAY